MPQWTTPHLPPLSLRKSSVTIRFFRLEAYLGLSGYDQGTLSIGLFNQYQQYLREALDVFQETKIIQNKPNAFRLKRLLTEWTLASPRSSTGSLTRSGPTLERLPCSAFKHSQA